MESSSWSDNTSEDKKDTTSSTRNTGRAYANPSNFIFGPGRSAVFGSSETIYTREEPVRPLFTPQPERSEPETIRNVTPAEVTLPSPVAQPEITVPLPAEYSATPYYASQEARAAEQQEDDDEDEEDREDSDDAASARPVPLSEVAATEVSEPRAAEIELPTVLPASKPPVELAASPNVPQSEVLRPIPPITRESNGFAWPVAASGNKPPAPPIAPEVSSVAAASPEPERPALQPDQSPVQAEYASPGRSESSFNANNYVTRQEFGDTYHDTRRKIAGAFATTLLVGWWLNRQSKKRDKALTGQLKSQQLQMNQLREQHEDLQARTTREHDDFRQAIEAQRQTIDARPAALPAIQQRQEAAPMPAGVPVVEQLFGDQVEQPIDLRPEEQLRQSTWHSYVEKNGKIVEGAIPYGEAFQQERARERVPTPFGANDARFSGASSSYYDDTGMPEPMLPSGQLPQNHTLPTGSPTPQDSQHLLPPSEPHPLIATLSSPWLWLGVGVLMIAFFLAASI